VTLREGGTPLIRADRLMRRLPGATIYLKYEGANPTGSFKDRGMTLAISKALEEGSRAVVCASTGNTSASAAAYAARAGVPCFVVVPAGGVALGKLVQALAHGARVVPIEGSFDDALRIVRELGERPGVEVVNSVNPFRIEGQTTAAYEICDALGSTPDVLALPVGNGGNITAYWLGFRRSVDHGRAHALPRILGVQASGAAPLVHGAPVAKPETIATAIRIGSPATWEPAVAAARDSGGALRAVPDNAILEAYARIAALEGVFCEPASAAGVAGLADAIRAGLLPADIRAVCVLTGHGLKDPDTAVRGVAAAAAIEATVEALAQLIGW
jgi:threonine synthase